MNEDEEKKIRYAIPLGDGYYIDSEASDEGTIRQASRMREQANLLIGLILGLVFGIVGNLFVSHFYGIFSAGIKFYMGEDWLNFFNLFLGLGLFISMVILILVMYKRAKFYEDFSKRLEIYVWKKKKGLIVIPSYAEQESKDEEDE